jgi:ribosomal protein S21
LDGRTSAVAVQHRGFIEVPVLHNNVEGALRLLGRKQKEEKILKRQTDGLYHIGPAERRKLNKKDSERRLQRKTYKRMLGFVMRRKMR